MLESSDDPLLGSERVVLQVQFGSHYGEIVLGFYPTVAPVTVAHILRLVRMGGYNTNEIFRVDKGFVAQVQGVDGGRRAPMSKQLRQTAKKNVPDEFSSSLKHVRGMLSMGKFDEPNTGTSSFSMVLGDAPLGFPPRLDAWGLEPLPPRCDGGLPLPPFGIGWPSIGRFAAGGGFGDAAAGALAESAGEPAAAVPSSCASRPPQVMRRRRSARHTAGGCSRRPRKSSSTR